MQRQIIFTFLMICIGAIVVAGCTSQSPEMSSNPTPVTSIPVTATQNYVTVVTPFLTPTEPLYAVYPVKTNEPTEDLVCLIYDRMQSYSNNKSAFAFNLVNPPMYLNFTFYETKNGVPDKNVFYKITIRDKNTGEIYKTLEMWKVQPVPNIGESLTLNLDKTSQIIKILSVRDLQIELEGNGVAINTEVWAKPAGNIEGSFDINRTRCIQWPQTRWIEI